MSEQKPDYRICGRCVMDTSDPEIVFDVMGICRHCHRFDEQVRTAVRSGEDGRRALSKLAEKIRRDGRGRDYDCIIGVSGGVDSTYVAWLARNLNLRPLAVHLDNGWNSELATTNIARALRTLGIDLQTHVINWLEFRDLQLSFLKASTPDAEIPTDHAIIALMYSAAVRVGVRYVLTGYNVPTESHMTNAWSQGYYDWHYIRSVHRQFGSVPLRTFPHMNLWTYRRYLRKISSVDVLNYVDYVKAEAIQTLETELSWKYYGGKHFESIYTRFYQAYILRRKWGFDKRRCHLSSLICSGEMTREQALAELQEEPYPLEKQLEDRAYVTKKLGITDEEFETIMQLPKKTYWYYPSYGKLYRNPFFRTVRRLRHSLLGGAPTTA
jgi:N-acetyl sugar amidotransferase